MSVSNSKPAAFLNFARNLALAAGLAAACSSAHAVGTWSAVTNLAPSAVNHLMVLPDGTMIGCGNNGTSTISNAWRRLTPSLTGSYQAGTWTSLANMADTRLYFGSQVTQNCKLFVCGGEYGTGTARAEIYDIASNTWTQVNPPASILDPTQISPVTGSTQRFYDSNSDLTRAGNVLIMPVMPKVSGQCLTFNPNTNAWTAGPALFRGAYQDEATWVKLPDDTILTMDPFGGNSYGGTSPSERYNPVTNTWINDTTYAGNLYDAFGFEFGGGAVLPNGKAILFGANGNTVLYTPTGTTAAGSWAAGPVIPGARGQPDAPIAVMPNGKILLAVSPVPISSNHFPTPTTFLEYDYATNAFTSTATPTGGTENISCYQASMVVLPNGQIGYSHMNSQVYLYQHDGSVLASYKPSIGVVSFVSGTTFHLTGTHLNGMTQGAVYGDDAQENTNFPIVRLTNTGTGNVYYCRSVNWNKTGIQDNGSTDTDFVLNAGAPNGNYNLQVVANGVASDPVAFTLPFNTGPGNNNCSAATDVSAGGTFNGTLVGATNDGTASCGISGTNPDVWYSYTAGSCPATLTVDAFGSNALSGIDTVMAIFDACGGTQLACNDDTSGLDSQVQVRLNAGQTVKIRVSKYNTTALLPFVIHVNYGNTNDACANAVGIGMGQTPWSNCLATTDGPAENGCSFCCGDPQVNGDVWYLFTAPSTANYVCDTIGSNFDTKLAIYPNANCPAGPDTAMACNDDAGGALGTLSRMKFHAVANTTYRLRAGGFSTSRGSGFINIHCSADFNGDGVVDFFDYLDFVDAFSANQAAADFNSDGSIDFFDYLDFVDAFSNGC